MSVFRAVVVGTGMMGPGISVTLAAGGISVCLVSRDKDRAAEGLSRARDLASQLRSHGLITGEQYAGTLENLNSSSGLDECIGKAQLVIESIPEDLALKQQFFEHLDQVAPRETILCSNTSGISITAISEKTRYPERVVTTHFWNPPHLMPLVEVVMGRHTLESVAVRTVEILKNCGKTAVLVRKDTPGQLGNRLQQALVREAIHIVREGIASVEDVDLAAKSGFGLRLPAWGILEHADAVGLDLVKSVQDCVLPALRNETQADPLLNERVNQGNLGAKTGAGFYDWTLRDMNAAKKARDEFLIRFLQERQNKVG